MLKRKIFVIIIFVIGFCCFQNFSYGNNEVSVFLESKQDTVEQGNEIEITVKLINEKMAACNFSIYFDTSKLEFIPNKDNWNDIDNANFMGNTNWIDNRINFVWFDWQGGSDAKDGDIAVFKFKAKEKGLTTFTIDGEFYGQNGQLLATNFKETQVQIGKNKHGEQLPNNETANLENSNSNLQVLRLDVEGMVPQFDKNIEEYYLNVPNLVQNLEVLAISENSNAVVEIKGNTNLQDGLNDITVDVTSVDKSQSKRYTIHVTKTDNLELANTNLEILAVENVLLNPPFDASVTSYQIEVSHETESINVFAVPENEKAIVEINGKENLQEGNNLVTITVVAQNGFTKKDYKLEVYKRNLEEEQAYQIEQEKRKGDLENAYKIQEVSSDVNSLQQQVTKAQNKKYQGVLLLGMIIGAVALGLAGVVWRIEKKK